MAKNLRVGKVFIDWSQNADHKTTVGVYSLRAKRRAALRLDAGKMGRAEEGAEKSRRASSPFEPQAALKRLKCIGDLFAPSQKLKQKLPKEFAILHGPKADNTFRSRLSDYNAKRNFALTLRAAPDVAAPQSSRKPPPFRGPKTRGESSALRFSSGDARRSQIVGAAERCAIEKRRNAHRISD